MLEGKAMQQQPNPFAGKGDSADAPRLWIRAIREGWAIPDMARRAAIARAAQILADPQSTRREVTRATQTLVLIERMGLDAAVNEDRMTRLDGGGATDRVELIDGVTDSQLAAVARALAPQPAAMPPDAPKPPKPCRSPKRKHKP
jgi:hypothetical protein